MSEGCFLNPHIDNSHDLKMERYRRLNLLYYVNEDWIPIKDGGELALYPKGINNNEINIPTDFNRLVIMRTDNKSLHGVQKITSKFNRRKQVIIIFQRSLPQIEVIITQHLLEDSNIKL